MKTHKLIILFILSVIAVTGFAQTKTTAFKVAGECSMCKKKIEKAAKDAGATFAVWNVNSKLLSAKYSSAATDKSKIEEAIAAAGYDTPDVKATDEAYKALDECCQYERANAQAQSCCASEKCLQAACLKDGKCAADAACCKAAGCDTKNCCKKA